MDMKMIYFVAFIVLTITGLFAGNFLKMGTKTEEQPYKVVLKRDKFEIRFYPAAIFAQVKSPAKGYRNESGNQFRKLAGFIFGGNSESKQIAMTAPVHMEKSEEGSVMHFVMPESFTIENLPKPLDPNVKISKSLPGYYAAYAFGGFAGEDKILKAEEELKTLLQKESIKTKGNFRYLGYNAPYEVFNRRNEIIVAIEFQDK
ncbi:MAG: heme-binding protein [Bacteroidetes bacterium]|nr:heme-binding protein [Bacteroidota bacterium]